jgi:tellurite resistance protein
MDLPSAGQSLTRDQILISTTQHEDARTMANSITPQEALIYIMVTTSAADRTMTDSEILSIGQLVQNMPVFRGFDSENLVRVSSDCGVILQQEEGLAQVLDLVAESLPEKLYETAYALAVEVAAADLHVEQEELRLLQMLRDKFNLTKLSVAAIEHGARVRYRTQ